MTFCLMAIVMFSIFVTIFKMFTVNMCMTLTLTFKTGQYQIKICYFKAIYDFPCNGNSNLYYIGNLLQDNRELTSEIFKIQHLTLKQKVNVIKNNVASYITGWQIECLQFGAIMADLFQIVSVWFTNEPYFICSSMFKNETFRVFHPENLYQGYTLWMSK